MTDDLEPRGHRTLVLGGTRSGKSHIAEELVAAAGSAVTYVATAAVEVDDVDHRARIEHHQRRRPASWRTVEVPEPGELAALLADIDGPVLVDSLGSWLAAHVDRSADVDALVAALQARPGVTVVVSEEVGWSLHAPTAIGRRFVDSLGTLNQRVAEVSDRVVLAVAGRVLELGPAPGGPPC